MGKRGIKMAWLAWWPTSGVWLGLTGYRVQVYRGPCFGRAKMTGSQPLRFPNGQNGWLTNLPSDPAFHPSKLSDHGGGGRLERSLRCPRSPPPPTPACPEVKRISKAQKTTLQPPHDPACPFCKGCLMFSHPAPLLRFAPGLTFYVFFFQRPVSGVEILHEVVGVGLFGISHTHRVVEPLSL